MTITLNPGKKQKSTLAFLLRHLPGIRGCSDFKKLFGEVGTDEAVSKQEMEKFARHVSRITHLFEFFDKNRTENAKKCDIDQFLGRMLDSSEEVESEAVVKELKAELEKDPDGILTLEEFQKLFQELGDKDTLSKDKVEVFVQEMCDYKETKAESLSKALLARLDNEAGDSISMHEFQKIFHEISVEIFCASVSGNRFLKRSHHSRVIKISNL